MRGCTASVSPIVSSTELQDLIRDFTLPQNAGPRLAFSTLPRLGSRLFRTPDYCREVKALVHSPLDCQIALPLFYKLTITSYEQSTGLRRLEALT